ncbi:transglutaminase domain-containing protein [Flexivirga sp. ID2601S]|uniref:Transglutaminase domain-containing protein n=1 Tax=Flexivirga aerilata TaxID=1656889 RepID=A0A849AJB2_9MICO|nr:transglutaminase domain-containing protein [Flexivirga aerilata]
MIARARPTETALALAAVVIAAWPLTTLLQGGAWLWAIVLVSAAVLTIGMALRAAGTPYALVLLLQLAALAAIVAVLNVSDHFDATFVSAVQDLVNEANRTIRESAAPAPVTPGLLMMLELLIPGLAITVDYLSVSSRQPALAGVPLLVIYLLSTSNTGKALNPVYFVALAAIWLVMVAHGGGMLVRGWSSLRARSTTPTLLDDQLGVAGLASVARTLGIVTILAALILPAIVPLPGTHYFAQGLGRGSGGGGSTVAFSTTANLANDLRSQNTDPVLDFTTSALLPPPLRVTVGGTYAGGEWTGFPGAEQLDTGVNNRGLPVPPGMQPAPNAPTETMTVTNNTMQPPFVPAPFPVASANFGSTAWGYSASTVQPFTRTTAKSYAVRFREPTPSPDNGRRPIDPNGFRSELQLDPLSEPRIRALARQLGGSTPMEQATAIQDYLRGPEFTYSLTLAPTQTVAGRRLDPLSNFLVTKQGYCTQFATAMIMLARANGIPARMALGFLPGVSNGDDVYRVLQSNAHAWPELYLDGLGWTRFEPTPGTRSGPAPDYVGNSDTAPGGGRVPGSSPSASSSQAPSRAPSSVAPSPSASQVAAPTGGGIDLGRYALPVVTVLVLGLLGALVLPLLARRRREAIGRRLAGHSPVEAQWQVLQSHLADLGIPPPADRSPRATERYYRSSTSLDEPGRTALHRAVQTLETERYARPGEGSRSIARDADRLLRTVRRNQSLPTRLAALVIPQTGRDVVRDAFRSVARWPQDLLARLPRRR